MTHLVSHFTFMHLSSLELGFWEYLERNKL